MSRELNEAMSREQALKWAVDNIVSWGDEKRLDIDPFASLPRGWAVDQHQNIMYCTSVGGDGISVTDWLEEKARLYDAIKNKSGESSMLETIKKLLEHPQVASGIEAKNLMRIVDPEGDLHHLLEPILAGESLEMRSVREWIEADALEFEGSSACYRIKPETITVGSVEINAPYREAPPYNTVFYSPVFGDSVRYDTWTWHDHRDENKMLDQGMAFKTKEDAETAQKAISKLMRGAE